MAFEEEELLALEQQVRASSKYACISPDLVRSIGARELAKRRNLREAIKSTRNKLHQVASSYREKPIPFNQWEAELCRLPTDINHPDSLAFLRSAMSLHVSTSERLPILVEIYQETLRELPPISSVVDLACGLNPLSLPWMHLPSSVAYFACDIYTDLLDFLNRFFTHFSIKGSAFPCDLTTSIPSQPVDLAIALKTIPCLEQMDKQVGTRLLEQVNSRYLLVSFPAHSLGGKSKGMVRNYESHFQELIAGKPWEVKRFEFPGELIFLVKKPLVQ